MSALACALFMAALGFSFALATSDAPAVAAAAVVPRGHAAANGVPLPLRFTNPFLLAGSDPKFPNGGQVLNPQGFDLGDTIYGTGQTWTRYLTVTGGYLPYTFATRANFDLTVGSGQVPVPIPTVFPFANGLVGSDGSVLSAVSFANHAFVSGALRFNTVVTDYLGTQTTGTFRLNVVPPLTGLAPATSFRFAIDSLPTAQMGGDYFTKLDTLGGVPTVTYQVAIPPTVSGTSYASLEAIGLTLTPDGILYGRPSFPLTSGSTSNQTVGFTIVAQDSTGAQAFSRNGAQYNQAFSLSVEPTASANSEALAQSVQISNGKTADSALKYSGYFDPKGATLATFAGSPFTLRIGAAKFTGAFDGKGKIATLTGANQSAVKCAIAITPQKSTISIKIPSVALKTAIKYSNSGSTLPVILAFEFLHYRACEALTLTAHNNGAKFLLNYKLGGTSHSMSGGCQLLYATGIDAFSTLSTAKGVRGDEWILKFVGVPRFGIDSGASTAFPVHDYTAGATQGSASVTVTIGSGFSQTVTATLKSVQAVYLATTPGDGIYKLKLDGRRFVHLIQTYSIAEGDTGIPEAVRVSNTTILGVGMSLTGYQGSCGKVIAPSSNGTWLGR